VIDQLHYQAAILLVLSPFRRLPLTKFGPGKKKKEKELDFVLTLLRRDFEFHY